MASVLDCDIIVIVLEPQLRYFVAFQTNTPEKDMNLLIYPAMD